MNKLSKLRKFSLIAALATTGVVASAQARDTYQAGVHLIDSDTQDALENVYDNAIPLTPEQEYERYHAPRVIKASGGRTSFRFAQTRWNECSDPDFKGSYLDYQCSTVRGISQILLDFMKDNMYNCVQSAADAASLGTVTSFHIEHRGIEADRAHSPRSLHSERRAIDVKSLTMKMSDDRRVKQVYGKQGNDTFFTELRSCWGRAVNEWNKCPVLKGGYARTGSIGTEDPSGAHDLHIHMSVPYCVGGKYAGAYFTR